MIGWLIEKVASHYLTEENIQTGIEATVIALKEYFSSAENRRKAGEALDIFAQHLAVEIVRTITSEPERTEPEQKPNSVITFKEIIKP